MAFYPRRRWFATGAMIIAAAKKNRCYTAIAASQVAVPGCAIVVGADRFPSGSPARGARVIWLCRQTVFRFMLAACFGSNKCPVVTMLS